MADLSFAELRQFSKYYGDRDLINNDRFWLDCLALYQDKVVALPLVDDVTSRRYLADLLKCPPGKCGVCCRYSQTPLNSRDVLRLAKLGKNELVIAGDNGTFYLDCSKGCPFLVDNECSIYNDRPDICIQFPAQTCRDAFMENGQPFKQIQYRIKCPASIEVVRQIFKDSIDQGKSILLPDLSLMPISEEINVTDN